MRIEDYFEIYLDLLDDEKSKIRMAHFGIGLDTLNSPLEKDKIEKWETIKKETTSVCEEVVKLLTNPFISDYALLIRKSISIVKYLKEHNIIDIDVHVSNGETIKETVQYSNCRLFLILQVSKHWERVEPHLPSPPPQRKHSDETITKWYEQLVEKGYISGDLETFRSLVNKNTEEVGEPLKWKKEAPKKNGVANKTLAELLHLVGYENKKEIKEAAKLYFCVPLHNATFAQPESINYKEIAEIIK